jgi:hypothetical protein
MVDTLSPEEQYDRAQAESAPKAPPSGVDNPFLGLPGYQPPAPPPEPRKPYTGQILPFNVDERGSTNFDPNAGVWGALKAPFDWAYGVRTGAIPADPRNPDYVGGGVGAAMAYGPGAVASRVGRGAVTAPGVNALDEAAATGFTNYRNSGQMYPGQDYRDMLQRAADRLRREGFTPDPASASVPHGVLADELRRVANHPFVTSQDIDALRVQMRGAGLKGPQGAGNQVARDEVFGYIEQNLPPGTDRSVRDAVGNYRQARHSEEVTAPGRIQSEKNIAAAQGPELTAGQNRDALAKVINARKGQGPRGFSDTELNILRTANRNGPDFAQRWGDRLGAAGSAIGALPGVGAAGTAIALGNPVAAAGLAAAAAVPAAAGVAARSYANRGARQVAAEADNAIRGQSPLARQQWGTSPPLNSGFGARSDAPLSVVRTPSGSMIEAAMEARRRELEQKQSIQPTYRVLPDGTVEELS